MGGAAEGGVLDDTLVNLAILRALHAVDGSDVLQPFVPLVAEVMRSHEIGPLGPEGLQELCDRFEADYGLRIPPQPMMTIVNRAKQSGFVKVVAGVHVPDMAAVEALRFEEVRREQRVLWVRTLDSFQAFAEGMDAHLSEAQAEHALLSFLKEQDCEILMSSEGESILPPVPSDRHHEFLASCFVAWALEGDRPSFDFVVAFATGHLLASAILNWGLQDYTGGLPGLYVYLDAPIILQLAGITIPARQAATQELLGLLKGQGVVLAVFEHSVEEAIMLLDHTIEWIDNPRYDPLHASQASRFVVDNGWTKEQVEEAIARLQRDVREAGILRRAAPRADVLQQFQIDESALESAIVAEYRSTNAGFNYANTKATILIDIKSLAAIHKLRHGQHSASLEDAKYVFMTTNAQLTRVSRKFDQDSEGYARRSVPCCVTDVFLGTLAWVKSPAAGEATNVRRVVADCIAALQPTPALVARMLRDLKEMESRREISPELHNAVRVDPVARRQLVELTENNVDRYTAQTLPELIREYEAHHEAEVLQQFSEERQVARRDAEAVRDYEEHTRSIARSVSLAIGLVVFAVLTGVIVSMEVSRQSNTTLTIVMAALGAASLTTVPFSWKARGLVYALVKQSLTPRRRR